MLVDWLSHQPWWRRLLGGKWYHVRVIVFGEFVTGWVKTKPIPEFEEVIDSEDWSMGVRDFLNRLFAAGDFNQSNEDVKNNIQQLDSPKPKTENKKKPREMRNENSYYTNYWKLCFHSPGWGKTL